ncbi:MAG TPA: hypothetical protein VFM19_07000 [Candidatus Limnocylindria bacterium]|nr:hypothetical protein [Candidatus Limnocylindria bacterium]
MQLITDIIEWIAVDLGTTLATLFPWMLLGLVSLYVLGLVIGYLRVSQVAIEQDGPGTRAVAMLPAPAEPGGVADAGRARGVPYCPVDGLRYPAGARFCVQDEAELLLDCANCGTTIRAAAESCFRCGTRDIMVASDSH